jgi:hypothetical protein
MVLNDLAPKNLLGSFTTLSRTRVLRQKQNCSLKQRTHHQRHEGKRELENQFLIREKYFGERFVL